MTDIFALAALWLGLALIATPRHLLPRPIKPTVPVAGANAIASEGEPK